MKYLEVVTRSGSADTISAIGTKFEVSDIRAGIADKDGMLVMRLLTPDDKVQPVLDALQGTLGQQAEARILVLPVEVALPKPPEDKRKEEASASATREALYNEVEKNARLDMNFLVLVVLSTVVAAIGLLKNNVAAVIGAMVIAPLLGPQLALGLGTALGDISLMRKSALSNSVGLVLVLGLSITIGILWPYHVLTPELAERTTVGMDSITLALASGAAAVLSLTTGLSSVLVGVMVAVALLPPAVTLGLMLGNGNFKLAVGAAILLAVNIVCVNLASNVVFFFKGIRPRTWWEQAKAKRAMATYALVWLTILIILVALLWLRGAHIQHKI